METETEQLGPGSGGTGRFPLLRTAASVIAGFGLLVALQTDAPFLPEAGRWALALLVPAGILLAVLYVRTGRPRSVALRRYAPHLVLLLVALVFVFSGAMYHRWFYFLRWIPTPDCPPHDALMVRFVFYTLLLTPLFLLRLRRLWMVLAAVTFYAQYLCFHELIEATGGLCLYRTDHPSFMFRLHEFSSTFPQFVNYNPFWNAGSLHYYSVTTGIGGPGLLLMPLWKSAPIHTVYTYGVATIFILLVPWMAGLSVRAVGGSKTAACVGGLLALGVSQHFFLWMLHYGTIGAALTSAMVLPVTALAFRTLRIGTVGFLHGLALVVATFLLLMWPPGALMGVPVALAFALHFRWWTRRKWIFFILCGLAVVLLYSPWLRVLLNEGGNVVGYVLRDDRVPGDGTSPFAWVTPEALGGGWNHLCNHLSEVHPVLLFLGIVGTFTAARGGLRSFFGVILLGFLFLTGWGQAWKPDFQLSRMVLPLCFVAVVPASVLAGRVLRHGDLRLAMVRAGLVSLLAVGAYSVSKIYANEGLAPFRVPDEQVTKLINWLAENTPEDARVMFSGKTVHAFGRGQIAYLPVLTGREMMACDYYNFPMDTVEYEFPPAPWRKPLANYDAFVEAYNVSHVVTYHERWKKYCRGQPDRFTEELVLDYISVFRIHRDTRPLLQGTGKGEGMAKVEGTVKSDFNRIEVTLDEPAEEVVLTYNWLDGLRTETEGVELFPYTYREDQGVVITLLGIRPGSHTNITITFRR